MDVLGKKKTYTGTIPPLTIASLIDIQLGIWKIDALAKTVPKGRYPSTSKSASGQPSQLIVGGLFLVAALAYAVSRPQDCPNAREWDNMTVETWKHQNLWTDGAKAMWDIGVRYAPEAPHHPVTSTFALTTSSSSFLPQRRLLFRPGRAFVPLLPSLHPVRFFAPHFL